MDTFQTIWKFSRHSGYFPDNLVTCQKTWKLYILSRLYGKCPDKNETFQTIQKHSKQSGNFPDDQETFQKLQQFSRQVLDIIDKSRFSAKTFRTRKNFPGSNAPAFSMYFCLWEALWANKMTKITNFASSGPIVLKISQRCRFLPEITHKKCPLSSSLALPIYLFRL